MSMRIATLLRAIGTIWLAKPIQAIYSQPPIQVAPSVDLARYAGRWY